MGNRGKTLFIDSPLRRVAAVCRSTGERRRIAAKGTVAVAGSSTAGDHTSVILASSATTLCKTTSSTMSNPGHGMSDRVPIHCVLMTQDRSRNLTSAFDALTQCNRHRVSCEPRREVSKDASPNPIHEPPIEGRRQARQQPKTPGTQEYQQS